MASRAKAISDPGTSEDFEALARERSMRPLWAAAVLAGLLAALTFLLWQVLLRKAILQEPTWMTTGPIASLALGERASRPPFAENVSYIATAAALHLGLAILYSCVLMLLIRRASKNVSLAIGVGFGILLYGVNLYGFAPALFPWMAQWRGGITFTGHLLFGFVLAYTYKLAQAARWKAVERPRADRETHSP
jgi:hypothetical protein